MLDDESVSKVLVHKFYHEVLFNTHHLNLNEVARSLKSFYVNNPEGLYINVLLRSHGTVSLTRYEWKGRIVS